MLYINIRTNTTPTQLASLIEYLFILFIQNVVLSFLNYTSFKAKSQYTKKALVKGFLGKTGDLFTLSGDRVKGPFSSF